MNHFSLLKVEMYGTYKNKNIGKSIHAEISHIFLWKMEVLLISDHVKIKSSSVFIAMFKYCYHILTNECDIISFMNFIFSDICYLQQQI
jgi:hypothetical protein